MQAVKNEAMRTYAKGSDERVKLQASIKEMLDNLPFDIPCVVDGELAFQYAPAKHHQIVAKYYPASESLIKEAIKGAMAAKSEWEALPLEEKCGIFLKAADLLAHKYRYQVMAATMIGQGKNAWQAEIDAAAELADFWRFNCQYAKDIQHFFQPQHHSDTTRNRLEFRGLEGFILAISPFNFTAIGGNLCSAPAIMGNVVLWKPSDYAVLSNWLVYRILEEAGLPPGVIQFLPAEPNLMTTVCLNDRLFAGLHFTGSTAVLNQLWKEIGQRTGEYLSFPRIAGESGGKNFHFVHPSADVENVVNQTVRAAFEYQGQKCSACSRLYLPESLAQVVLEKLKAAGEEICLGGYEDFEAFGGPVIHGASFKKILGYIQKAKEEGLQVLTGGTGDDSQGWFIRPTILLSSSLEATTLREEIFGPVLTVYVYADADFETMLTFLGEEKNCAYALTGAIFAKDRRVIDVCSRGLRQAAGNFYVNDKCTGAVVGQQPFGGARASGTNDKAGSALNLLRWTSPRTIKECTLSVNDYRYPSNYT